MKTRYQSKCAPDHECTNEEIRAIFNEHKEVSNDTSIIRYDKPTIEEMETIIQTAENYTGKWYHSEVNLDHESNLKEEQKTNPSFMKLHKKITELGENYGIYLTLTYDIGDFEMPNPEDYDEEGYRKNLTPEKRAELKERLGEHLEYRSHMFDN